MPGFCRPIEFSIQPSVSAIRGGGFPSRGSGVTVFDTNASSARATSGAVSASRHPLALRIGTVMRLWTSRRTLGALRRRPCGHVPGLTPSVAQTESCKPPQHRAIDAKTGIATVAVHYAAIAGAVSAGHRGLPRELGSGHQLADGLEHRLRAAREDVA